MNRKALVLLVAVLMVGVLDAPAVGTLSGSGDGPSRHVGPLDSGGPWTDPLEDASHVYVNATMPVGVEVGGGDAHLEAGVTEGWLASEVIACPPGYRYDLVLLEVDTPGRSHVNVTILDASVAAPNASFANGTLEGFEMMDATDMSLNSVSPVDVPRIRVQVNLFANGTDRPRLLSWSVHFVDLGEWREEFLGTGKMTRHRNLNLTGNDLRISLDRSKMHGTGGDYEPFPTLTWTRISDGVYLMYPNEDRTGYLDGVKIPFGSTYSSAFGDFDRDGYMDLVIGGYQDTKTRIVWGDDTGTYGLLPATILDVDWVEHVVPGDYNGDGWTDILMVTYEMGGDSTQIFLNDGDGNFNSTKDIVFRDRYAIFGYACNLNGDKYDDIVVCSGGGVWGYHGGPNGPDAQHEFFIVKDQGKEATAADLDGDGYTDVVIYGVTGPDTRVYMNTPFGMDEDPDHWITEPAGTIFTYNGHCGDLNGDGYMEIIIPYEGMGGNLLAIYNGSASGWNTTVNYTLETGRGARPTAFDLDKDGYDDLMLLHFIDSNFTFDIFMGKEGRLDDYDARQTGLRNCHPPIATAAPRPSDDPLRYSASLTTENIHLPTG
ncbi:MAG: VCBS repeat-containing protein, partial [Thermoplasmata archaeon]